MKYVILTIFTLFLFSCEKEVFNTLEGGSDTGMVLDSWTDDDREADGDNCGSDSNCGG